MLRHILLFMLFWPALAYSEISDLFPERRKAQFATQPAHVVIPFPYSLPGIGSGLSLIGGFSNVNETYIDAYGVLLNGDISGIAAGLDDIHLISRRLVLETGLSSFDRASISAYGKRGMRTEKNDYSLVELSDIGSVGARLTATFFDRRFEMYGAYYKFGAVTERIRNSDGDILIELDKRERQTGEQHIIGILFDLTDDYSDPRKGVRMDISGWYHDKKTGKPEYLLLDINTSAYVPVGKHSTLALNLFKSDATIFREGQTDRAIVAAEQGLNCAAETTLEAQQECDKWLDSIIAQNKYGTASSLGGFGRLRSYPQGRYSAAHVLFFGTELRWNITDEFTPFDIYVVEDVRTAAQLAVFYEVGSVVDRESELGSITRSSYGVGVRAVTASGAVFRGDLAYGDEGFQPNIFIGYPWEM